MFSDTRVFPVVLTTPHHAALEQNSLIRLGTIVVVECQFSKLAPLLDVAVLARATACPDPVQPHSRAQLGNHSYREHGATVVGSAFTSGAVESAAIQHQAAVGAGSVGAVEGGEDRRRATAYRYGEHRAIVLAPTEKSGAVEGASAQR